jgi:phosphoribosylamine-glycine ligase
MANIEKYNQAFIETLEVAEDKLATLKYHDVEAWDSVGHMTLMAALEDAFDIMMETEDIVDFSSYEKGKEIHGLEAFRELEDAFCFHAGTALKDGKIVTNGGRVLGITALGKDIAEARKKAYEAADLVQFSGKYYRHDIAHFAGEE